jgi:hypothetical protein
MQNAVRWWGATVLIVIFVCLPRWVPPRTETGLRLVPIAIPESWKALPITARLSDEVATGSGCARGGGYDGTTDYQGRLGRFRVYWSVYFNRGINAGGGGWRVVDQAAGGSCQPLGQTVPGTPVEVERPDTLHENADAGVYVLEGRGRALSACRLERASTTPPPEVPRRDRLVSCALMGAVILTVSWLLRRRWAR